MAIPDGRNASATGLRRPVQSSATAQRAAQDGCYAAKGCCTKCSAGWAGLGTGALGAGQHVELQAWQANGNCWFGYLRIMQAEEEDRGALMSNMFLLTFPLLHHHHPKDSLSKCHHTRIPKGPYKLDTADDWVLQPSHSLRPSELKYSQP